MIEEEIEMDLISFCIILTSKKIKFTKLLLRDTQEIAYNYNNFTHRKRKQEQTVDALAL